MLLCAAADGQGGKHTHRGDTLAHLATGTSPKRTPPSASVTPPSTQPEVQRDPVLNSVLQASMIAQETGQSVGQGSAYRSPSLPQGEIAVGGQEIGAGTNSSGGGAGGGMKVDGNGREYTQVIMGPGRLTKPEAGDVPRVLLGVPTFNGNGVTMSFW